MSNDAANCKQRRSWMSIILIASYGHLLSKVIEDANRYTSKIDRADCVR